MQATQFKPLIRRCIPHPLWGRNSRMDQTEIAGNGSKDEEITDDIP